jgi:hypothetical protein
MTDCLCSLASDNVQGTVQYFSRYHLWQRVQGRSGLLDEGQVPMPRDWLASVNRLKAEAELAALRRFVVQGCPFGSATWVERTVKRLGLEATFRPPGRLPKRK